MKTQSQNEMGRKGTVKVVRKEQVMEDRKLAKGGEEEGWRGALRKVMVACNTLCHTEPCRICVFPGPGILERDDISGLIYSGGAPTHPFCHS